MIAISDTVSLTHSLSCASFKGTASRPKRKHALLLLLEWELGMVMSLHVSWHKARVRANAFQSCLPWVSPCFRPAKTVPKETFLALQGLDFTPYMSEASSTEGAAPYTYDLAGVCAHDGKSVNCGHYRAVCRSAPAMLCT